MLELDDLGWVVEDVEEIAGGTDIAAGGLPPKLVMSILPRLREQNDEIIALRREQNELLRRGRPEPVPREGRSAGEDRRTR